jgi:hypothetical protein
VLRRAARAAAAVGADSADATAAATADLASSQRVCRLLQLLATLRGAKTVAKFFPHGAADLEPALALLRASDASRGARGEDPEGTGAWEVRATPLSVATRTAPQDTTHAQHSSLTLTHCPRFSAQTRSVLLLWLSILVLIPFDLSTVDSTLDASAPATGGGDATPPVVRGIIALCRGYLREPGIVRDMAALALAKLLTRPDMGAPLAEFIAWCRTAMATPGVEGTFLVPGAAATLAGVLKHGSRAALAPSAPALAADVYALAMCPAAARSPLLRKLAAKLAQRVGLLLLPPRQASWRYTRGASSLLQNLGGSTTSAAAAAALAPADAAAEEEELRAEDVPEAVDAAFEQLLTALHDSDTVVRWAAAKGVGRLAARLPGGMADEVLSSVLAMFSPTQPDGAWHGGCLALAELARRGALLPSRLSDVVPRVADALRYDVRRGPHSVGAHVRDAAAYVAWAAARAYDADALAPAAGALAPPLLALACYDREVNCRRAAAAAFQECVGRLGGAGVSCGSDADASSFEGVPHGIAVVAVADYISLGPRAAAYLSVAPRVAAFASYRRHLAEHLLGTKLLHWDASLRALAASALAALAPLEAAWLADVALPALLPRATSASSEPGARHGALLALAACLGALRAEGADIPAATQAALVGCVPALEKARLYRGKGGESVRFAAAKLVAAVAAARLPATPAQRAALLASAEESLRHPAAEVQAAAAAALGELISAHALGGAPGDVAADAPAAARRHVGVLARDPNPAARRGSALALASLPRGALAPAWRAVARAAAAAATPEADAAARDAETRVNAVIALGALIHTVGIAPEHAHDADDAACEAVLSADAAAAAAADADDVDALVRGLPARAVSAALLPALLASLDDYCTDNRGDVGSWVREAAMRALPRAACALAAASPRYYAAAASDAAPAAAPPPRLAAALLKQAAEKIDRVRTGAASALASLLSGLPPAALASVPHADALAAAFPPPPGGPHYGVPAEAYPSLAPLLRLDPYRAPLAHGMLVSVGGLGDSLSKTAAAALLAVTAGDAAAGAPAGAPCALACAVAADVVAALAGAARADRVAVPALRTLDVLYSHARLAAAPEALHAAALTAVAGELRGARDVPKLCAAAALLAHLAGVAAPAPRDDARRALCGLLAGPYPRVRRAAAEALYLRLLDCDDSGADGDDAATETLASTRWDAAPEVVRAAVATLYGQLALGELPATLAPGGAGGATAARRKAGGAQVDEHDSYRSLVDAAGY